MGANFVGIESPRHQAGAMPRIHAHVPNILMVGRPTRDQTLANFLHQVAKPRTKRCVTIHSRRSGKRNVASDDRACF